MISTKENTKLTIMSGSSTRSSITSIGSSVRRSGSCIFDIFDSELTSINGISDDKLIQPSNKKLNILIIDDCSSHRKLLKRLLEWSFDFQVVTMNNGDEFLSKLDSDITNVQYDLILMDYLMPGTSGIECIKIAREKGYKKLMFGLTAMSLTDDVVRFYQAGCDAILLKPFKLEKFQELIENFGWKETLSQIVLKLLILSKYPLTVLKQCEFNVML